MWLINSSKFEVGRVGKNLKRRKRRSELVDRSFSGIKEIAKDSAFFCSFWGLEEKTKALFFLARETAEKKGVEVVFFSLRKTKDLRFTQGGRPPEKPLGFSLFVFFAYPVRTAPLSC